MSTPAHDPDRPYDFLWDRMRAVDSAAIEIVHAQVQQAVPGRYGPSHSRVMAELRGGDRPSRIARRLGVSKPAVGQLVAELEREGLVERAPDPSDGRAYLVRPTAKAGRGYREARRTGHKIEAEWEALLGREGLEQLKHLLDKLEHWVREQNIGK